MEHWAKIIEAARSVLGLAALCMLVVGGVAIALFPSSATEAKVFAFSVVALICLGLATWVLFGVGSSQDRNASRTQIHSNLPAHPRRNPKWLRAALVGAILAVIAAGTGANYDSLRCKFWQVVEPANTLARNC